MTHAKLVQDQEKKNFIIVKHVMIILPLYIIKVTLLIVIRIVLFIIIISIRIMMKNINVQKLINAHKNIHI